VSLLWCSTIRFEADQSPEETGAALRDLLSARESSTHRASLSIRPQAVRLVQAEVPEGVTRIPEWIEDNAEKLLQLPIPLSEIVYGCRSLPAPNAEAAVIEIGFVRRQEVEKCLTVCRLAGLEPVFLGAAPRATESKAELDIGPNNATAFRLAALSFSPNGAACDFLPPQARVQAEEGVQRNLTKRFGLSAGGLVLGLLLLEFLASAYVDSREKALDESWASTKTTVSELNALEKNVKALEDRLAAVRSGTERTELARVLHDVASVPAKGVRFRRLGSVEGKNRELAFAAMGQASSHEQLARFLAALDTASFCRGATLLKSGTGSAGPGVPAGPASGSVFFELEGRVR
jgi:hypothetical protein